ncbi:NADH-quinone oxidoreductase subunit J [Hoyosella rhizosphaerae]|uniref:NADH-quinone oxidoreductase subunit J n=1 Tax=Hoyosella rhizosphaerae TaxID=1755582 RepID=A0A916U5N6_9ACTN|nr:NADH-quinone oxidoreductase subunit J [Hoyosella rhizosphaerae]MBN4926216.1 NADH-quinone oxidoreductase subunit J [Hoyosella rhizosphaerae]GGC61153.1 NADH-quinone oxidoreductase subunit J [Hoyosella rhizosphaerae]
MTNLLALGVGTAPFTQTSTAEAIQFWVLGAIAVIGALGVVTAKRAVHSALFLALTMIILAVFYIVQGAMFLGVAQIVVYTGAVMMLFLFVLMLIGVESSDSLVETIRGQRVAGIAGGLGFGLLLVGGLSRTEFPAFVGLADANVTGNVPGLAELLFIRYVWAFELTGALLIIATIGAMVLAHREQIEKRRNQREQSEERFRTGTHVTPMPSPGVFARHNAVNVPALLPDGSYSRLSVSKILQRREAEISGLPPRPPTAEEHEEDTQ